MVARKIRRCVLLSRVFSSAWRHALVARAGFTTQKNSHAA